LDEKKTLSLKCTACADVVSFECEVGSISFKPTPMFQTRVFNYTVKNTSRAVIEYNNVLEAAPDVRPSTAKSVAQIPNSQNTW
jgi:hypothetical protein